MWYECMGTNTGAHEVTTSHGIHALLWQCKLRTMSAHSRNGCSDWVGQINDS
jgi:hypothetical protein